MVVLSSPRAELLITRGHRDKSLSSSTFTANGRPTDGVPARTATLVHTILFRHRVRDVCARRHATRETNNETYFNWAPRRRVCGNNRIVFDAVGLFVANTVLSSPLPFRRRPTGFDVKRARARATPPSCFPSSNDVVPLLSSSQSGR